MCPEEETKGSCKLTRCPYPHRSQPPKTSIIRSKLKAKPKAKKLKRATVEVKEDTESEKSSVKRYFTEDANQTDGTVQCVNKNSVNDNSATVETTTTLTTTTENSIAINDERINVKKRPKLGTLPSFIPIG